MKGFITRTNLEQMVINTLKKGATMQEVYKLLDKLNIQIRGDSSAERS